MTLDITRRNAAISRDATPRLQRSRNGVIFVRRNGRQTLGIVFPNKDGDGTFSWASRRYDQGQQPQRYQTQAECVAALLAVLGLSA